MLDPGKSFEFAALSNFDLLKSKPPTYAFKLPSRPSTATNDASAMGICEKTFFPELSPMYIRLPISRKSRKDCGYSDLVPSADIVRAQL